MIGGLIERYDRIALEDLPIVNMARSGNRDLSKSILDAGWGYLKLHLAHNPQDAFGETAEAGRVVCWVNPPHTSNICSQCGGVCESLTLADRWVQSDCGLSLDRGHNAALN